jgi:hypothetical protein
MLASPRATSNVADVAAPWAHRAVGIQNAEAHDRERDKLGLPYELSEHASAAAPLLHKVSLIIRRLPLWRYGLPPLRQAEFREEAGGRGGRRRFSSRPNSAYLHPRVFALGSVARV